MKKLGSVLIMLVFVMSLVVGVSAKQQDNETEEFLTLDEYNEYYSNLEVK